MFRWFRNWQEERIFQAENRKREHIRLQGTDRVLYCHKCGNFVLERKSTKNGNFMLERMAYLLPLPNETKFRTCTKPLPYEKGLIWGEDGTVLRGNEITISCGSTIIVAEEPKDA